MKPILLILTILLTSCSNPKVSKLLFKIESRDIAQDQITEYRYFDNGQVEKTILHNSSNNSELFTTSFKQAKPQIELLNKLQNLDYHNHFPWKQDYYKRGNVLKVEFPKKIKPQYITDTKQGTEIMVNQTYFFYTGDEKAPELVQELISLTGLPRPSGSQ